MLSEKQLEANRANAQKSTGPTSEAGKKRSSLNAARHGLTGHVVVLLEEDMEAYNNFAHAIVADFTPVGAVETQLAQSYAGFQWRINRAAAIEDNMFTLGIMEENAENLNIERPQAHNATSYAKTFRDEGAGFARLAMYSQRLVNQAEKVLKQLKQLQAERLHREQSQFSAAARMYKFHAMQQITFDPKAHGFDLTIDQIRAYIRSRHLNDGAVIAEKYNYDHPKFEKEHGQYAA